MNIRKVKIDLSDMSQCFKTLARMSDSFRYVEECEPYENDLQTMINHLEIMEKFVSNMINDTGDLKSECSLSDKCVQPLREIVSSYDGGHRVTGVPVSKPAEEISDTSIIKDFGEF